MDEHLKAVFRVVTAIVKWIGEHWLATAITGGGLAYILTSTIGVRG